MGNRKLYGMAGLFLIAALMLSACSGGGSSGSPGNADAMTVADRVSVVDAKLSGTAAVKPLRMAVSLPADSDFMLDETNIYVHDRSIEMFGIINEILCAIGQTKYDQMLNLGAYTAQVDLKQCSSERGDASQGGQDSSNQSSGSTAPSYEVWTVDASRIDNNSPQIVKAWIHQEASEWEPAQLISAKVTITEGKSDTNPYGIFRIDFKANLESNLSLVTFKGVLKSERDTNDPTKILLKFVDENTDLVYPRTEAVTLNKLADGTGTGTGYRMESYNNNGTPTTNEFQYDIAYNADYFLRSDGTNTDVCLDRNTFDMSAWRYGLYDAATGDRVNRNSGFPIRTTGGAYGNVGYWGLWLPDGVALNSGDTVIKHDYQANTDENFTVFKAAGKLKKHTRQNLTLGEIKNIPLNYNECPGGVCTNYMVTWNGSALRKVAYQDPNNWTWTNYVNPVAIDPNTLPWGDIFFWSQALGGQARVTRTNCTWDGIANATVCDALANATQVVFYREDIVYPTDTVPATLACYDQCPKAGASGINLADPIYATWDPMTGQSTRHDYTFNKTTMLLKDGLNSAISTTVNDQYQWGFMSGALFEPTTGNLAALACDWDVNQTCGWKAWSALSVFYTWETGPNNWNQFTAIKDSLNAFVKFDPPLQVEYVHSQTDTNAPDYKYNNVKFFLDYSGFGQLWGIPGVCVDMDSGLEASCGPDTRWVPEFFIPAGSLAGSSSEYAVKPLDMEQRMKSVATSVCATAGLTAASYTLPSITEWTDPAIGAEPNVTDPPAVIGGVVQ